LHALLPAFPETHHGTSTSRTGPGKDGHQQNSEQQPQYPGNDGSKDKSETVDSEALLQVFPPRNGEDPVQEKLLQRLGEEKPKEGDGHSQSQQ